jgi:hypothetical protein
MDSKERTLNKLWLLAISLLLLAAPARAQTNDQNWRSWAWTEEIGSPRDAGLAGAVVADAESYAPYANPAAMAFLHKTEVSASVLSRGSGRLPAGDATAARTGVGYVGGAGRLTRRVAIGAYITRPHDVSLEVNDAGAVGYLDTQVTDAGVAVGWAPAPRLALGLRLNLTHLKAEGLIRDTVSVPASYEAGTAAAQTRLAGDAGLLLRVNDQVALGLAYSQGARWNSERTAHTLAGIALPELAYQISSPNRFSAGLAVRPNPRLLAVGQVDYVLLERLSDTFQVVRGTTARQDYAMKNAFDARAGVEFSQHVGRFSVQGRAGIHSREAGAFRYSGTSSEAGVFRGQQRETLGSVGASLVSVAGYRLDIAAVFGDARTVLSAGVGLSF